MSSIEIILAVCMIVGTLALVVYVSVRIFNMFGWIKDAHDRPLDVAVKSFVSMQPAPVYVSASCGRSATYDEITEPCARRRGHLGKCMTDTEIQVNADSGLPYFVKIAPSDLDSQRKSLMTDIMSIAHHVDVVPVTFWTNTGLQQDERLWLDKLKMMVDATMTRHVDPREKFSEWDHTK